MSRHEDARKLLYRIERAMGRHLFLLGVALLIVIAAGLATPAIVVMYAMRESQPWWMAAGATLFTLAGVAAVLHAVPRILGPRGITGIVEARNRSAALPLLGEKDDELLPPSGSQQLLPVSHMRVEPADRLEHRSG